MKAVLMSGSFRNFEIQNNIIKFINDNINNEINIAFVSDDFDNYDHNDKSVNKFINAFLEKNIKFNNISVIDNRISNDDKINCIKSSNIIFILGGDTLKQIDNIKKYNLIDYICNNNKITIGISAGAINMAKKVVLARDIEDNIPELSIYDGIGITDINIEPHCDFENKEHWKDLKEASFVNEILVTHDDAYLIIDDDNINYYGTYCKLNKGLIYYNNKLVSFNEFVKNIK